MKRYIQASVLTVLLFGNAQISSKASEDDSWSDFFEVACDVVKQGYEKAKPYVDEGIERAKPFVSKGVEFAKNQIEAGKEVLTRTKAKIAAEKNLWEGIRSNNLNLVKSSLEQGASANCIGHRGETPLHRAAALGDFPLAELLVAFGANAVKADEYGMSPIDIAQKNGHSKLVNYLRRAAN